MPRFEQVLRVNCIKSDDANQEEQKGTLRKAEQPCYEELLSQKVLHLLLDKQDFACAKTDWDGILSIPGNADCVLRGNDSDKPVLSSKTHLLVLGPKFMVHLGLTGSSTSN